MTDQYARLAELSSSLDKRNCVFLAVVLTGRFASRYAEAMARCDLIAEKLTRAFDPARLEVVDESHQHAGHAGHREGGETHFRVYIVAEAFRGKSRLERHRMINETLVAELQGGVHALAIHASAPGEGGA
jgi:BolA family transcriptional regulator, general stress-responsive regulator